jgi:hypothetical protein
MPTPLIREGCALIYPGTGPDHDGGRPHTHIVVKDDVKNGDVYLVPVCSAKPGCDKTCPFERGVPYLGLDRKSFVSYFEGKKVSKTSLVKRVQAREIRVGGHVSVPDLDRIKDGIARSPKTEPWFAEGVNGKPKRIILPTICE